MEKGIQCYMSKYLLLVLMGALPFASQNDVARYVLRKHDSGNPYVVFFCKGADNEKVKENSIKITETWFNGKRAHRA